MRKLFITLLAAIALPTAVNAESYWLFLTLGDGGNDGAAAMEKIQMPSIDACEKEGEKWMKFKRNENGVGRTFINDISHSQAYICITGK